MVNVSRADLALSSLALSVVLIGLAALAIAAWRRPAAAGLTWFGLFSVLYGSRVALGLPIVALIPGLSRDLLPVLRYDVTYVLALPLMLLVQEFVGAGWHHSMRAAVWVQAVYSIGGVIADAAVRPGTAMVIKPYIIVGLGVTALGNTALAARRTAAAPRALAIGFLSFLATVGVFNLGEIVHRPVSARVEVLGFVVLLACVGYSVLTRVVATEARLVTIEREIETAQRIQNAILPAALPSVPGLVLAVRYQPVTMMAGDFYDVVEEGADHLGILIADASGHGIGAALIASMLKVAVTTEAARTGDAGALLTAVNTRLVPLLGRDRDYVTACYLSFDRAAGEFRYARAGHPPPLVRRPGGDVRMLDSGGTILGQFEGLEYTAATTRLEPGSRILLYTDGITEAANPEGEFFGLDRLSDWFAGNNATDPTACADALLARVADWRRHEAQADDVTVIVVDVDQVGGSPAEN